MIDAEERKDNYCTLVRWCKGAIWNTAYFLQFTNFKEQFISKIRQFREYYKTLLAHIGIFIEILVFSCFH